MANINVAVLSHNKPRFIKQAIQCLINQTYQDWEAVVMDSGVLYNSGFFNCVTDSRIHIITSNETEELRDKVTIASWCFNKMFNSEYFTGKLICHLCDDDYFLPNAFQEFWNYYELHNFKRKVMYCSEYQDFLSRKYKTIIRGRRYADVLRGKVCGGLSLHSQVDYLQVCFSKDILEEYKKIYNTTEYYSEDKLDYVDADSVFLENLGSISPFYPINKILCIHQNTYDSRFYPPTYYTMGRSWLFFKKLTMYHWIHCIKNYINKK